MTDILKTPKSIILPDLMNIEDEKVKRVLEEYNRVLNELVTAVYSDVSWLYESSTTEGEWTPTLEFGGASVGITYSVQAGLYTKIGRVVTVTGYIHLTSKGTSTGQAKIEGLPFAIKDADGAVGACCIRHGYITYSGSLLGSFYKTYSNILLADAPEDGTTAPTNLTNTHFKTASFIQFTGTYFTD